MTADADPSGPPVRVERVPWLVVLLSAGGIGMLPNQRMLLERMPTEQEPVDVALSTRFEDLGLTDLVPRELVVEIRVQAEDADRAVVQASSVAGGLVAMLSFAVNAYVAPAEPLLAYESAPGLLRRRFWEREVLLQTGVPRPNRQLDPALFDPLLSAFFRSTEASRMARTVSQYHMALRYWTTAGQPLALAHLYMALEALAPAAERSARARLGLADERAHAQHRGIDVTKNNWKDVLLGWVRRDEICQGDKTTYDAARKASDGFEHGFMGLPEFKATAAQHARALLDYLRAGILDLLDLPASVRAELAAKRPLDVSPLWQEVRGELHGAVEDPARLGEEGAPYPYADWHTTLDDARRLPDGRLQLKPRINLTARLAQGVQLTFTGHGLGVGLSDTDLFDYQPSGEEPTVIHRAGQGAPNDQRPARESQ